MVEGGWFSTVLDGKAEALQSSIESDKFSEFGAELTLPVWVFCGFTCSFFG